MVEREVEKEQQVAVDKEELKSLAKAPGNEDQIKALFEEIKDLRTQIEERDRTIAGYKKVDVLPRPSIILHFQNYKCYFCKNDVPSYSAYDVNRYYKFGPFKFHRVIGRACHDCVVKSGLPCISHPK